MDSVQSEPGRQRAVERRRAPRAKTSFPIQLVAGNGSTDAIVKDLSSSGICFTHDAAIEEMTLAKLSFELPGESGRHEVQGAVVRCAEIRGAATPTFEVAMFFVELSEQTKAAITKFVGRLAWRRGGGDSVSA